MRELAQSIWQMAIDAVEPARLVSGVLTNTPKGVQIAPDRLLDAERFYIFAAGKAAMAMASAAVDVVGSRLRGGVVIAPAPVVLAGLEVYQGSHPVMDEKSIAAAHRLLEVARAVRPEDAVIFLLSGGASALMEVPAEGLSLGQMQETFGALLGCGAPIESINCVRKHLSQIKGGRLAAQIAAPTAVLVISDVIGDDLEAIGSAPLYFDRTTFEEALGVLERFNAVVPDAVRAYLQEGQKGRRLETPKEPLKHISHHLIGTNHIALQAAADAARKAGFEPVILTDCLEGEAKEAGRVLASIAKGVQSGLMGSKGSVALIFGGETTVNLKANGRGGRNQELALGAILGLKGRSGIALAVGGSDGIDGASHAAGAAIDSALYAQAIRKKLDPRHFLAENNSTAFFESCGGLIITGPTGTNVMDVGIILVEKK